MDYLQITITHFYYKRKDGSQFLACYSIFIIKKGANE